MSFSIFDIFHFRRFSLRAFSFRDFSVHLKSINRIPIHTYKHRKSIFWRGPISIENEPVLYFQKGVLLFIKPTSTRNVESEYFDSLFASELQRMQ